MNQCGIASYPTKEMTGNNAYCQSVANWFQSNGRWGDRNFTDLVAGDTIFFDWEGDGHTDHIGLVIGRDESKSLYRRRKQRRCGKMLQLSDWK